MTRPDDDESRLSVIDVVHVKVGRPGFIAALAGLVAAALLFLAGFAPASRTLVSAVLVLLIVLPVVNVVSILLEEVHDGDVIFAWMAGGVLALIGFNVLLKL